MGWRQGGKWLVSWNVIYSLNTHYRGHIPYCRDFASDDEVIRLLTREDLGIDYTKLRDLLAAGKWEEADRETTICMSKVKRNRYFKNGDIDSFPCEDLRSINELWVKYSYGKFGFSVQKKIYQSLGGTNNYHEEIWEAFGEQVGWCQRGSWLSYSEIFQGSLDTYPKGHLPVFTHPKGNLLKVNCDIYLLSDYPWRFWDILCRVGMISLLRYLDGIGWGNIKQQADEIKLLFFLGLFCCVFGLLVWGLFVGVGWVLCELLRFCRL
ncbi:MAG: GUN4 domain-containing protein [Okeania sp. SIO2B3]|nr:GUN4 domain-containing protein [Okeania sp. SIO2B3]